MSVLTHFKNCTIEIRRRSMRKLAVLLFLVLVVSVTIPMILPDVEAGWLNGWNYRRSHTINGASGAGTNYQVRIKVYYGGGTPSGENTYCNSHCRTDFGDVKFTLSDGTSQLSYWIQYKADSNYAIFWVKVSDDLGSSRTIYIYYGKPDATTAKSLDNTFVWGDDFESGSVSKWYREGTAGVTTSYRYEGSYGAYTGTGASGLRTSSMDLNWQNVAVHAMYYDRVAGGYEQHILECFKNGAGASLTACYEGLSSTYYSYRGFSTWWTSNVARSVGWHEFCVRQYGSTKWFVIDGVAQSNTISQDQVDVVKIGSSWGSNGEYAYWDAVFVRKFVNPEPSHGAWGAEEQATVTVTFCTNPSSGGSITVSGVGTFTHGQSGQLSIQSYTVTANPPANYQFSSWSYTGGVSVSGEQTGTMTVSGAGTVTANFQIIHYQVTFTSSGIGGDSSGSVVVVNGNSKTQAQLPYTASYNSGSTINYEFKSTVPAGSGKQYVWISTSGLGQTGRSGSFTVAASGTVTGSYKTQYQVTFTSSGVVGDSSGTVVTVNGNSRTQSQLPYTAWYDSAPNMNYEFSAVVPVGSGKQYVWTSTDGLGQTGRTGSFQPSSAGTVTGVFGTQFQITFTSSGIGGDSSGTVVAVNGNAKTQSQLPYTDWYSSGSTINYDFSSIVASTQDGKRSAWTATSGLGQSGRTGSLSVNTTGTVTGTYKVQYQVSVSISPLGGGSVGGAGWYDSGSQCSLTATPASNYRFSHWSGDGTGSDNPLILTVNITKNVVANFVQTAQITVTSNPTGSGFVKVDDSSITTPQTYTWDVGSQHALEALSSVSGGAGTRYVWTSWSGGGAQTQTYIVPVSSETITATYQIEYQLTMQVNPLGSGSTTPPEGSSWHVSGTVVNIEAFSASGYIFSSWTGSGSGSYSGTNNPASITMNGPIAETANFEQAIVSITFQASGLSGTIQDVLTIDESSYDLGELPKTFQWTIGSDHEVLALTPIPVGNGTDYIFTSWTNGDGLTGPVGTYTTPSSSQTITAKYLKKYQLTIEVNNLAMGTTNPELGSYYYDSGTDVQVTANPNSGYDFVHWQLDGGNASSQNPITVTIDRAHTLRAIFCARAVNVTITSNPTGSGFVKVDGANITTPQTYNWNQDETHDVEATPQVDVDGERRYVWVSWSDGQARAHTITVHGSSMTVTSTYKTQYSLAMRNVEGRGTTNPASLETYWYDESSRVNVSATPHSEWEFHNWILDGNVYTDNPISVNMNQNHTLQAVFESVSEAKFTVTIVIKEDSTPIQGMTVKLDTVEKQTDTGGVITFKRVIEGVHVLQTPLPYIKYGSERFTFIRWTDGSSANPRTVTISENASFTALFNVEYKLSIQTIPAGLSPHPSANPSSPDGFYSDGVVVQLSAPDVGGMNFYAWTIDGMEQPAGQKNISVKMDRHLLATALYTQPGSAFPHKSKGSLTFSAHDEIITVAYALSMLTSLALKRRRTSSESIARNH